MTLFYWSVAWLAGILAASKVALPLWLIAVGCVFSILPVLLYRDKNLLMGLFFFLGMARYFLASPSFDQNHLAYYNDYPHKVEVIGVIARDPDKGDTHTRLTVAAQKLNLGGHCIPVKGRFLVWVPVFSDYRYGDRIIASGLLVTPPRWEDFSYRDYLARQGVFSIMRRARVRLLERGRGNPFWHTLYALRKKAQRVILQSIHEPEASLLSGILLGLERGIPADLMEDFRRTGTSHIIAISGFNIAVLVGFLNGLLGRLVGRRAWPFILIGVGAYTLLVGADATVVRAAIMGGLYVLAGAVGRTTYALVSLGFAALFMSAFNPFVLWDVGFQLSFAATLGLIVFVPWAEKKLEGLLALYLPVSLFERAFNLLNEAVVVTLAAQIATLPLIIYYFGNLSLIGPAANFLVIPAQPGVMLWGAVSLLGGLLWLPLGRILGWVAWLYAAYTIRCVELLARPEWASIKVQGWRGEFILAYYLSVAGVWLAIAKWEEVRDFLRQRWRFSALVSGLSLVAILIWAAALAQPDGRLHVVFCDVGEGDGIFIRTPGGHKLIIDGGPSPSRFLRCIGQRMPFWDNSIDLVILTHPDKDHLDGLVAVLERYKVEAVLEPGIESRLLSYKRWRELIEGNGITRYEGQRGMRMLLSDGVALCVLNPVDKESCESDNNCSVVIRLVMGKASFLFTGDAEREAEERMLASGWELSSTVLKVAHHGSKGSTTPGFLKAVRPQVAVISVGADNRFGHPAREVLKHLEGIRVLRTDRDGTVEIVSDGRVMWLK